MTDSKEPDPDHGMLELVLPDGRRFRARINHALDLKDPGRFLWPTHMALIDLARQATDHEEGPMDISCLVSSLVNAEYRQRYISGVYRGLLKEALRLLADLGIRQDERMLKAADKEYKDAQNLNSGLYRRFNDLMRWPSGRPWGREETL